MDDFRKFMNNTKQTTQTTNNTTSKEQPQGSAAEMEFLKNIAKQYDGKSEDKLLSDIVNNVLQQKQQGKLKNEDIVRLFKTVSPMLNTTQREKLGTLVDQLIKL